MSDNEKKNIELNNTAGSSDPTERLRAAGRRLSPSRSDLTASHISEDERAERSREAKAKLRENIERAGRAAAERRELADSKSEYRRDVLTRESKNAEAARRERARLEADARLERARRIEEERELYLQREREENARASESVLSLFERLSAREANALAEDILEQMTLITGLRNRGIVERPGLYVLRRTAMPSVLIELGFISNPAEQNGS